MRLFFLTNRNFIGGKEIFGGEFQSRPDSFRVGWADFDPATLNHHTPVPVHVELAREQRFTNPTTGKTDFSTVGSTKVYPEIVRDLSAPNAGGMVFIPGFNYSFRESLGRTAHLAHTYSTDTQKLVPIVFSWPSDGKLSKLAYISDRRDAELSGTAMARAFGLFTTFLRKLRTEEQCTAQVHLLAHSMGVFALRNGIATLSRPDFPVWWTPIFNSIIVAAGDDDQDTLENTLKMWNLGQLGNRIDVYVNQTDKPVRIGDNVAGGEDRIGAYGPLDPGIVDRYPKPLSVIDCKNVADSSRDGTLHQYYRLSPEVIADIKEVFNGVEPEDSKTRKGRYDEGKKRYVLRPTSVS